MILFSDDEEDVDLTKLDLSGEKSTLPTDDEAQEASLAAAVAEIKAEAKSMLYDDVEESSEADSEVVKKPAKTSSEPTKTSAKMVEKAAKKLSNVAKVKQVDLRTEDQVRVDDMLTELDNIEAFLGMQSSFDDIKFPEPKPIFLPKPEPVSLPTPTPVVVTKADIAKLDDEQLEELMKKFEKVDTLCAEVEAMKNIIDDRLNLDFVAMYENILEKNNIEAIKTYRNVQAVVVEEAAKQNRALFGIDGKSDSLKRRLNNVIIFSIVSFVVSILVMLMQILPALGLDIF